MIDIHLIFRKSSINALLPASKIKQDADGFDSLDSYFPEDTAEDKSLTENRELQANLNKKRTPVKNQDQWRIEPSPSKEHHDAPLHDEYEVEVPYDDGIGIGGGDDHVASPDVDDGEIVFKRAVKPRASIGSANDQSSPTSRKPRRLLLRKRSLLSEPLVDLSLYEAEQGDMDDHRRSHRKRFAPLAFWKNEKVVYGRRNSASTKFVSWIIHFTCRDAGDCGRGQGSVDPARQAQAQA